MKDLGLARLRRAGSMFLGLSIGVWPCGQAMASGPARALLPQSGPGLEFPSAWRIVLAFALAAGLAVAVTYALKRFAPRFSQATLGRLSGRASPQGRIRVLDSLTLPRSAARLHLLQVDGRDAVLAENRHGLQLLWLPDTGATATPGSAPQPSVDPSVAKA